MPIHDKINKYYWKCIKRRWAIFRTILIEHGEHKKDNCFIIYILTHQISTVKHHCEILKNKIKKPELNFKFKRGSSQVTKNVSNQIVKIQRKGKEL